MSDPLSVKVNSRYQVSLPNRVRKELNIQAGDHLLVDVQDGLLILIPQPDDIVAHMAGLHREIWQGVDTTNYLSEERAAWLESHES
ncbi:MAG: AbrB/MazE/SpoVT family DNA-binding domain-containing protein [Candidatus Promineifilaceae bacterium]